MCTRNVDCVQLVDCLLLNVFQSYAQHIRPYLEVVCGHMVKHGDHSYSHAAALGNVSAFQCFDRSNLWVV